MPFTIVRDDLVNYDVDAVVVSTNESLVLDGGNGYDLASKIGLAKIQDACSTIGGCTPGNAVAIETGDERNPLMIFAVGPRWINGNHGEPVVLDSALAKALQEAVSHDSKTLALPLIATGAFGFPSDLAFQITINAIEDFLQTHDMDVTLVLFDREAVKASIDYGEIKQFIDDHYADSHLRRQRSRHDRNRFDPKTGEPLDSASLNAAITFSAPVPQAASQATWEEFQHQDNELETWLEKKHDTFSTTLLRLIDSRGMTDTEVYKRANMSRQLFSKIRSDSNYRPKKKTVLALAVALELNLAETSELLNCAGFSLSQSSRFDLIVEFFIRKNVYDCFAINEALFAFGEDLL